MSDSMVFWNDQVSHINQWPDFGSKVGELLKLHSQDEKTALSLLAMLRVEEYGGGDWQLWNRPFDQLREIARNSKPGTIQ